MATKNDSIKDGSFNGKYKNRARDFFIYGFKGNAYYESQTQKRSSVANKDWERLYNMLEHYFDFNNSRNRNTQMFMRADSESFEANPMMRLYRGCIPMESNLLIFFHTILILHVMDNDFLYHLDLDYRVLDDLIETLEEHKPFTVSQIYNLIEKVAEGYDEKTVKNKLMDLANYGYLVKHQGTGRKGQAGTQRYSLSQNTLGRLIENGKKVDKNFEAHLSDALNFFSRYTQFGEIGMLIKDRFRRGEIEPFRFKHDYLTQCLNDFNAFDLLDAVENNSWCLIKTTKGLDSTDVNNHFGLPLELRTAFQTGRQYVMLYKPFDHQIVHLRIDFIDSIKTVSEEKLKTLDEWNDNIIKTEIERARERMNHAWGVSMPKDLTKEYPLDHVHFQIIYDPHSEKYILNRMREECRNGNVQAKNGVIDFEADVTDAKEMRPWVRSFCKGLVFDPEAYDFGIDFERWEKQVFGNDLLSDQISVTAQSSIIPDNIFKWAKDTKAHNALFNDCFSFKSLIIADALDEFARKTKVRNCTVIGKNDMNAVCDAVSDMKDRYDIVEAENLEELDQMADFLQTCKLIERGFTRTIRQAGNLKFEADSFQISRQNPNMEMAYRLKYPVKGTEKFWRDILPLSTIESRWLATVIDDPKADNFFSDEEKQLIQKHLDNVDKLPMKLICVFDQFHQPDHEVTKEREFLARLTKAVSTCRKVRYVYRTSNGVIIKNTGQPLFVTYAKRKNAFYVDIVDDNTKYPFQNRRISRLIDLQLIDNSENLESYTQSLEDYRKNRKETECYVTIRFNNRHNSADRILNEFSPWKKACELKKDNSYELTITYHRDQKNELAIRLLEFGENIIVVDGDEIINELKQRFEKQKNVQQEIVSFAK
ncbi:MAG: WYL domain-containing protein [Eubacteriaceae bacterium]|nr:WYL domain-containing protein [Eubacteriaceae bacterium]